MDPSKRICLKNLPAGVTKREVAELVRNRTGAQPHSIDLGLDGAGEIRRYAHFSCEGAKGVLEVLQNGVVMRDTTVYGHAARPHFSFVIAEARRKREREEETEQQQLDERLEQIKKRALERTRGGELPKDKFPKKTTFSVKAKYGNVASELAKKFRDAHRQLHGKSGAPAAHAVGNSYNNNNNYSNNGAGGGAAAATAAAASGGGGGGGGAAADRPSKFTRKENRKGGKEKPAKAAAKAAAPPPPPPPPPAPSKEEKKLSGLQARLAALKEKLKKN